ncbi:metallophosphoesterase [Spirillospora sp. CA-294931]|uniref:metallophosphoesterase n=1 Tax=Spirillospora sp. CA-294931 TaxID=3240042 RepID=UPI003D94082C
MRGCPSRAQRLFTAVFTAGLTLVTPAAARASTNELPDPSTYDAAIAWLPDTQFYSARHPRHFKNQTRWLVDNAATRKIGYATHTGDIVHNASSTRQWNNADAAMGTLDEGKFPYGIVQGNHDVGDKYFAYFGEWRFKDSPVYSESFKNNRQHYDLVDVAGRKVLMLSLTWAMRDDDFAWAKQVLTKHSNLPVIVSVHAYLNTDGTYDQQGQRIFDEIVKPYANVKAVLCGHNHGAAHKVRDLGNGRKVPEILADYQRAKEGGLGYLRLLQFDLDAKKMIVDTYSPSLNDSSYFATGDDFTVDVDLLPPPR